MSSKTHIFPSLATALAFMAGVEWVNDSAIELVDGPTHQPNAANLPYESDAWTVGYEDADDEENLTFDHRLQAIWNGDPMSHPLTTNDDE